MILRLLFTAALANAAVRSHIWRESKLLLETDTTSVEIEWVGNAAVRLTTTPTPFKHDPILAAFEDGGATLTTRTRLLTVEIERATEQVTVGGSLRFRLSSPRFEARYGEDNFFSNGTLGIHLRNPAQWAVDSTMLSASGSYDVLLVSGNSPKEVLDHYQTLIGKVELTGEALAITPPDRLPPQSKLIKQAITSWETLAALVAKVNRQSLAGIQYPALDLAAADSAPAAVKQRFLDFAALFPILTRSSGSTRSDRAIRDAFTPYFLTYLREGYDRGYPLIRPFVLQFPLDAGNDDHPHEFMFGDELLAAPVVSQGNRRRITLPRGIWTDIRTNTQYRGNQTIEIDAPPGRMPLLARNGSLVPLATGNRTELHYMPALGGEFFQWEPAFETYSQYHAAPAGDYIRVETESKTARTYEWVIHHTKLPKEVAEDTVVFRHVNGRSALRPNTWWYDSRLSNLHILVKAERNSDRIVNIQP